MEILPTNSKGSARNIILELKKQGLIELYCRSKYAFYKLKNVEKSKIKKPMTLSRMGGSGLRRINVDLPALLDSMDAEELCKVHDVRLVFTAAKLYDLLIMGGYRTMPFSKDICFGTFAWSKYRQVQVFLHANGTISFVLDCSDCPVESSAVGFVSMAAFLGGVRNRLLNVCRDADNGIIEESVPLVDFWKVAMWHYGKDSAQEFSGEAFNITFKMWCGELARIYVHEQENSRKVRFEVLETPRKTLQQVIANKLNLCCRGCKECLRQS